MTELVETFGYTVYDFDVRAMESSDVTGFKMLLYACRLLIFKNQTLSPAEYVTFARRLGEPIVYLQEHYRHPEHPEIFVSSNEGEDATGGNKLGVARAGDYWHADGAYLSNPYPLTMLYPQRLPDSQARTTCFIDMSDTFDALPEELKQSIAGKSALHDGKWRYRVRTEDAGYSLHELLEAIERMVPPVSHPVVTVHPVTGEEILYVNRGFTTRIEGLPFEESETILSRLFDFCERDAFVHRHLWEHGDIAVWDNRSVLHRAGEAMASNQYSTMFRITVDDRIPLYERSNAEEQRR